MVIFTHTDCDRDSMQVRAEEGDPQEDLVVLFGNPRGRHPEGVRLDREAQKRLYNALGHHLSLGEDN